LHQLTQGTPLKHRYPIAQQKVFKDAEVTLGTLAVDFRFPRQSRQVEQASLGEADHLQKAGKIAHLAHQRFGLYFLLQVETGVGREGGGWIRGIPDQRYETDLQSPLQIKGVAELSRQNQQAVVRVPLPSVD
jgi:hypothetical protein